MKTYAINLSISGDSEALNFLYDIMAMEPLEYDFINQSMDVFKTSFDDPYISSMMVSGTCEITSIDHNDSTVNIRLVSGLSIPFGWLHALSHAFKESSFTVDTTDELGAPLTLLYASGDYKGGGYNNKYFFNN